MLLQLAGLGIRVWAFGFERLLGLHGLRLWVAFAALCLGVLGEGR